MPKRRTLFAGGCATLLAGGGAVGLVAVVAAVAMVPSMVKARADSAISALEDQLGVDIAESGVSASLFAEFPRASVTVSDLAIVNRAPFDGVELFKAKELTVAVDVWSLITDQLQVRTIVVRDASVDLRQGVESANWALGGESSDETSESGALGVNLDDVLLDNVTVRYSDAEGTYAEAKGIQHRSQGSVSGDRIAFATETTTIVSVGTSTSSMLKDLAVSAKGPLDYSLADGKIAVSDLAIALGELPIALNGHAVPAGDGWDTDLAIDTPSATFASVLSLLPPGTIAKGLDAKGVFSFGGTVAGHYGGDTLPGADLKLVVREASVSNNGQRIDGLAFDSHVERQEGPWARTKVSVSKAQFSVADSPMTLSVTALPPLTDPLVDLVAMGKLNLGAIDDILGLGLGLKGLLDADFAVKAKASALTPDNPGDARGQLRGQGLTFPLDGFPDLVNIAKLDLGFSAASVDVNALQVRTGPTDVALTGKLERALGWAMGTANLGGRLALTSDTIDLRTLASDAPSEGDDAAVIVPIPSDIDMAVDVAIGQVYQGDYHLKNVKGAVVVQNSALRLEPLTFATMGGTVKLDGSYTAATAESADLDMKVAFEKLSLNQVMKTMDSASAALPAASKAGGTLGGAVDMKTRLLPDTSPDLESLFSKGLVLTLGSSAAPAALKQLGDKLGNPSLASMGLDGTEFDYLVEKGRLSFKPVNMKLGNTPAVLKGSAGVIDQTVDLGLAFALPTKGLSGAGLKLPKAAENVDIVAKITGPYSKPKLGVEVGGLSDIVDAVKEEVVEKVKDVVNNWIDEAEKQGDKLIAEAEKAADALRATASKAASGVRSEAKKSAAKLEKEAKNPVTLAAAKKAGEALVKQADKEAKKIESEADKKGDGLVSAAKDKKAKLVADARAKTD